MCEVEQEVGRSRTEDEDSKLISTKIAPVDFGGITN